MDRLTALALAAGGGDQEALADFVRASQGEVWRLCAHLVDRQSADDLTQDTYLRAVKALPAFRGDSSARTWLLVIARRACADAIRRRTRRRRLQRDVNERASLDAAVGVDASGEVALQELVDRLDPDRASAFVLTQVLGLSYLEAAEVCECPVGTIRSRVARARAELVGLLAEADITNASGA